MPKAIDLFASEEDVGAVDQSGNEVSELLIELLDEAPHLLVKKLSNNDRDWAQLPNKHQGGVYIPVDQRDGGFFPKLKQKERDPKEEPIFEAFVTTEWPQISETKRSRLVN